MVHQITTLDLRKPTVEQYNSFEDAYRWFNDVLFDGDTSQVPHHDDPQVPHAGLLFRRPLGDGHRQVHNG